MSKAIRLTEISKIRSTAELIRLAEEVKASNESRVLTRDGEKLVEVRSVTPSPSRSPKRVKTKADYEAFHSAAGGWKGLVNPKALKETIKAARGSDRPPVNL